MKKENIFKHITAALTQLCVTDGNRHVGSPGNRKASEYVAGRMTAI